jgi:hypothetical protein
MASKIPKTALATPKEYVAYAKKPAFHDFCQTQFRTGKIRIA